MAKPIFITLTSPSAAGKSYLLNYIREVAKLPCLVSTTTRAPRKGEREGIDYFFISEEESLALEREGQLAELAIYNGVRYGVTKKEFADKLSHGIAFLIVEPTGIDHYVQPALDAGAISYKAYIHLDPKERLERFRHRAVQDMKTAIDQGHGEQIMREFTTSMNRLTTMLTVEMQWGTAQQWDRILMGDASPEENLKIILADIAKIRRRQAEVDEWHALKAVDVVAQQMYRYETPS